MAAKSGIAMASESEGVGEASSVGGGEDESGTDGGKFEYDGPGEGLPNKLIGSCAESP